MYSDANIAWKLNEAGYRLTGRNGTSLFGRHAVRWILQNRFYLGETTYKDETMPGNHEPIISQELFDRCQEVRHKRRTFAESNTSASRSVRSYPLTSLLKCVECGFSWRGHYRDNKRYCREPAYDRSIKCSQRPKSVQATVFEDEVLEIVRSLRIPDDWRERALELARQQQEQPTSQDEVEKQRRSLQNRLERAKNLYIMGDISESEYKSCREEIEAQMPLPMPVNPAVDHMAQIAELLTNFDQLIELATQEELKAIYQLLFTSIYVKHGEIIAIEPTDLMWALINCAIMKPSSGHTEEQPPGVSPL
jgi:hypothetical protein